MPGPSVAVRIIGDLTNWSKSIEGAGTAAETGTSRIKGAFSSVLGVLNKTGVLGPFQDAIDGVGGAFEALAEKTDSAGKKLLGTGAAVAGIGATLMSLGSGQKEAQQQLQTAIENTGGSWDAYSTRVGQAVKAEEAHGETAAETMGALQKLTQVTRDPAEALKLLGDASDLAAAKHEDLSTAATQLGKVYAGSGTRTLKEFGITVKESGTQAVEDLAKVTKGQGEAAADSFNGKIRALKATVEDAVSSFANKFGPAITAAGGVMTGLGATIEIVKGLQEAGTLATIAHTVATTAQTVATGIATAAQWALNAALNANPIGVVIIAIAALVAAFVLAYQHITVFREGVTALWNGIKTAFDDILKIIQGVFNWIAKNWPLLLGILTGPFGLLLAAVITHWQTVENFLASIPGRIAAIFTGAASWLVGLAGRVWDGFVAGLGAAWGTVTGFFARIPGRIISQLGDAGSWLYQVGREIIGGLANGIKDAITAVPKAIGGLFSSVVNLAKKAVGAHSPSTVFAEIGSDIVAGLALGITNTASTATNAVGNAMSSMVTGATLPAVTGAVSTASNSPLVNIENVSSDVDVDLLAQKVSAVLLAGRV